MHCARADSDDAPVRDHTFDAAADIQNGVLQVVRKWSSRPRRIGAVGIKLIQSVTNQQGVNFP